MAFWDKSSAKICAQRLNYRCWQEGWEEPNASVGRTELKNNYGNKPKKSSYVKKAEKDFQTRLQGIVDKYAHTHAVHSFDVLDRVKEYVNIPEAVDEFSWNQVTDLKKRQNQKMGFEKEVRALLNHMEMKWLREVGFEFPASIYLFCHQMKKN